MAKIKKVKEKICEALEGLNDYNVSFQEMVTYEKTFKARSHEEIREKFGCGELEFGQEDIVEAEFMDDSLEVEDNGNVQLFFK